MKQLRIHFCIAATLTALLTALLPVAAQPRMYPYAVAEKPWYEGMGNHRAVIEVKESAQAVELQLEWRRGDEAEIQKRFLIIHAESGDTIANVQKLQVNNERCDVLFGPVHQTGTSITLSGVRYEASDLTNGSAVLRREVASYFLGAGLPGQDTPSAYEGKWDTPEMAINDHGVSIPVNKQANWLWPFDSFWMGNAHAGLHCELRGTTYSGPLLNAYRPAYPTSWYNGGKGGFRLKKEEKATRMTVYSGERTLKVNQPLTFEFALQLTDGETLRIEPRKGWLIEVN